MKHGVYWICAIEVGKNDDGYLQNYRWIQYTWIDWKSMCYLLEGRVWSMLLVWLWVLHTWFPMDESGIWGYMLVSVHAGTVDLRSGLQCIKKGCMKQLKHNSVSKKGGYQSVQKICVFHLYIISQWLAVHVEPFRACVWKRGSSQVRRR